MNLIHLTDEDPWASEDNRYDFYYKDLPCLIMRNHSGVLCGYVGVTKEHPYFGLHNEINVHVHGGVTFSEFGDNAAYGSDWFYHPKYDLRGDLLWWIGFHCAQPGDYCPGTADNLRKMGASKDMYEPKIIGHFMEIYRDADYVIHQVMRLADQLEKESHF